MARLFGTSLLQLLSSAILFAEGFDTVAVLFYPLKNPASVSEWNAHLRPVCERESTPRLGLSDNDRARHEALHGSEPFRREDRRER